MVADEPAVARKAGDALGDGLGGVRETPFAICVDSATGLASAFVTGFAAALTSFALVDGVGAVSDTPSAIFVDSAAGSGAVSAFFSRPNLRTRFAPF